MNKERRIPKSRKAHHLWAAESDESGAPRVRRSKQEPEQFDMDQKRQARTASKLSRKIAGETCAAYLGLFGADLVDDPTLNSDLPNGVVRQFNAASREEAAPRVHTWDELREAFTHEVVQHARGGIANGMQVRMASKYLDVPFMIAADIVDRMQDVPKEAVKKALDYLKSGGNARNGAVKSVTARVAKVLSEYKDPGSHRIAVDGAADSYWTAYYGPFGTELVREVQKRVRADLGGAWLRKNGVDSAAAEYWKNYYGEYGERWVTVVPKKISPSK